MSDRNAMCLSSLAQFLRAHPPTPEEPLSIFAVNDPIVGAYWEARQGGYTMTFTESFSDVVADLTVLAAIGRKLL